MFLRPGIGQDGSAKQRLGGLLRLAGGAGDRVGVSETKTRRIAPVGGLSGFGRDLVGI